MGMVKSADLGVSKEQTAVDVARAALDRNREITPDRQMAWRHPVIWRVVPIARIVRDVVAADDTGALEGRLEHFSVARHRKLRKRLARHAGDRVQRVRLTGLVDDVVEECAELR